jgi:regulator of extracellular matrix RemA (YlzA/DUF370 family)
MAQGTQAKSGDPHGGRPRPALVNVGFDNAVAVDRVVAIVSADPSPMKRLRESAERARKLVDATNGRRTRTMIIMDSDHVILSSLQPDTIAQRVHEQQSHIPDA